MREIIAKICIALIILFLLSEWTKAAIEYGKRSYIIEEKMAEPPKLPKIDRDAALELLESGECIGGEIEEAKFTIWVCKE